MEKYSFNLVSFALGVVAGVAVALVWFLGVPFLTSSILVPNAPGTSVANTNASGAVSVSDQTAGNTVLVESVTVPPPGVWVAVRETNSAGELGNVLGAARARGPVSNFTVELLRVTDPGRVYAIELYRAEDNGIFDYNTENVYVDFDTGERVVAFFKTK